jgi:hypothetical protein
MLESAISILSGIAGIHSWFTGIKSGKIQDNILKEVVGIKKEVERLANGIFYVSSIQQVRNLDQIKQEQLNNKRQIREMLEPLHKCMENDILSTAIISTPEKLQKSFKENPWNLLFDIRPLHRLARPANPDHIPIFFIDNEMCYVGWQMKGSLPFLFNCKYDPERNLYIDSHFEESQPYGQTPPSVQLRSTPIESLSANEVEKMLKERDFFDSNRNKQGKGLNHQYEVLERKGEKLVIDHTTGLTYQQSGSPNFMFYANALKWISELNKKKFTGYDDWRLPTLEEAMSLMDTKKKNGDLYISEVFDQTQRWVWTADKSGGSVAWVVGFDLGIATSSMWTTATFVPCAEDNLIIRSFELFDYFYCEILDTLSKAYSQ